MAVSDSVMSAVRSHLEITWESEVTDERLELIVKKVSPHLASRLSYESTHEFTDADGAAFGLFLDACFYEFNHAIDDFWENYKTNIDACRMLIVVGDLDGDSDAEG